MTLERSELSKLVILALLLVCAAVFVRPVSAGFPVVSDTTVWNNGVNTLLNVTVSHSPQTSFHHLDRIEVNLNGDNRIFPVAYRSETTFIVTCDLGVVEAPTNATIRARCSVDGYSVSLYGPIPVPEFSHMLFLSLFMTATLLTAIACKRKRLPTARSW